MAIVIASLLDQPTDSAFALARTLYDRSAELVARHGYDRHRAKVKLAADDAHIAKLDKALLSLHGRAAELEEQHLVDAAAVESATSERRDLLEAAARAQRDLHALTASRWLRLLDAVERPVRRIRPGTTVLDKIEAAADRVTDPDT